MSIKLVIVLHILLCSLQLADADLSFTHGPTSPSVAENAATDTSVVLITPSGGTGVHTYTIESQTPDSDPKLFKEKKVDEKLQLDVAASNSLDFETAPSYVIVISAKDSTTTTPKTGTTTITVTITDVNEAPVFNKMTYVACVEKGANAGTELLNVTATDEDKDDVVHYVLSGGSDYFTIARETGAITVKSGKTIPDSLDSNRLTVNAIDDDTSPLTGTTTVNVTIGDPCPKSPDSTTHAPGNFAEMVACNTFVFMFAVLQAIVILL